MANETNNAARPAVPTPVETVRIKIDGREVDIPKLTPDWQGKPQPTTMLQACQHVGIDVPHYCYHPKLPVAGNCRMCLLEFGTPMMGPDRKPLLAEDGSVKIAKSVLPYEPGTPRGAIGCATPISPGMEIYPNSSATKQMREAVLESLLVNHPLDCPICDQAGECKLQEYSIQHGQATSRFVESKVHKPKQVDLGPRIMLDDERCVLCSRCIRFTKDIVGDDALGFVNRGSYNTITAFPGKPFDNNYTLNTVDLCPVGALTSKDFRFQMRVWFLKETKSICGSCGTGCNIVVGGREGKIYRFEPRQNDAVNSAWMCDAGRLNYKWVQRNDRLTRLGGSRLKSKTWSSALGEMIPEFKGRAKGSIALIASSRLTTEELYLSSKIAEHMGAITETVPRLGEPDGFLVSEDKNPNTVGASLTGITNGKAGSKLALIAESMRKGEVKVLICLGEDLTQFGFTVEMLKSLELIVVWDILPNSTTALAHYVFPGAAHLEKLGTFVNVKGRVQKFVKAVEPPGDAKPEFESLLEFADKLGCAQGIGSVESCFNQMGLKSNSSEVLNWNSLGDTGVTVQH